MNNYHVIRIKDIQNINQFSFVKINVNATDLESSTTNWTQVMIYKRIYIRMHTFSQLFLMQIRNKIDHYVNTKQLQNYLLLAPTQIFQQFYNQLVQYQQILMTTILQYIYYPRIVSMSICSSNSTRVNIMNKYNIMLNYQKLQLQKLIHQIILQLKYSLTIDIHVFLSLLNEELVKVTAQQCILVIIIIVNKSKIGLGFLCELQMAVFYHQVTKSIKNSKDEEGAFKYFIDLIFALKQNIIALNMLLNSFVNNIMIPKINDLYYILSLMNKFTLLIRDHEEFQKQKEFYIRRILCKIICNYNFNKYINGTYVTTKILMTRKDQFHSINLEKYFQERYLKLYANIQKFNQENYCNIYVNGWLQFNRANEEITNVKSQTKQINRFIGWLMNKSSPQNNYIKYMAKSIGLKYEQLKYCLFDLQKTLDYKTSIYFIEDMMQEGINKNKKQKYFLLSEQNQIYFNDYKGQFHLDQKSLTIIYSIISILKQDKYNFSSNQVHQGIMEFQQYFIKKFKLYLLSNLCDLFLPTNISFTINQISLFFKIFKQLQISLHLEIKNKQKLIVKIQEIQQEINQVVFKNDFHYLIDYITQDLQNYYIQKGSHEKPFSVSRFYIHKKMFFYQLIRNTINPKGLNIRDYLKLQWQYLVQLSKKDGKLQILKKNKEGGEYLFKFFHLQKVQLIVKQQNQQNTHFISIQQMIQRETQDSIIKFEYIHVNFTSQADVQEFNKLIQQFFSFREEYLTKCIIKYFQIAHKQICNTFQA